jgi:DNA-binding NarL/FixJ family response regulator
VSKLHILLADDHEVVRRGIRYLIQAHPGWEVCAEACDGKDAVEQTLRMRPDIIILDMSMPGMNGLEATRRIVERIPEQRILILTMYDSENAFREVLQAGADGVLLKSDASLDLIRAIEALEQHKTFFTERVARTLSSRFTSRSRSGEAPREPLTSRELEVTRLLAEGKSSKEVAVALNISVKTAQTHRSNIMSKLDIHCISELVLYAARNNIIHVSPTNHEEESTR